MPWTREEKYLTKFNRKFNFNNYRQKSQIYRWVPKLQATSTRKQKIPDFAYEFHTLNIVTILRLINIVCLNIHGAHVTANNSINNNVVFFFFIQI